MGSTKTQFILTDYIDDFVTDYSPYLEWLVTSAYVLSTMTDNPYFAIDYVLLSEEENVVIKSLIEELAIFQNRPSYMFEFAFQVSDEVAKSCEENIQAIVRTMTEYHESVFKKIELFYNYGFFGEFGKLDESVARKFAELVWGDTSEKSTMFALHLIMDYFHKCSIEMPPLGKKEEEKNYSPAEIRWMVIGDLLDYFSKPPGAAWLKDEQHPILKTMKRCDHLGTVSQVNRQYICDECGEMLVDTLWDDDYISDYGFY